MWWELGDLPVMLASFRHRDDLSGWDLGLMIEIVLLGCDRCDRCDIAADCRCDACVMGDALVSQDTV